MFSHRDFRVGIFSIILFCFTLYAQLGATPRFALRCARLQIVVGNFI